MAAGVTGARAPTPRARARIGWRDLDGAGRALLVVVLVALVVRLVVAVRLASVRGYGGGDQADYRLLAENLIGRNGYRTTGALTAWRSPGYPVFLAVVLRAGHALPGEVTTRGIVGVAQAFVGAGTVALTGLLGRRIARPSVGVVAAAVLAVWPSVLVLTGVLLTETLFALLLVAAVLVAFWHPVPSTRAALAAGALLGAATLVRASALPVAVALVAWLVVTRAGRRRVGAVVLGVAVLLAPWVLRNAWVFEAFVPTDTHGGYALCQSNRDGAGPEDPNDPYCRIPGATEVDNDVTLRNRALGWMVRHPATEARLVVERAAVLAREDGDVVYELRDRDRPDPSFPEALGVRLTRLADGFWRVVAPVGAVGAVLLIVRRRSRGAALVLLSVMALPLVVTVSPRFHQPLIPLLALGVGALADALRSAARRHVGPVSEVTADSR